MKCMALLSALALVACGGNPPPQPPQCPKPPPPGDPTFTWAGNTQLDISWEDMPVVVCEGEGIQARILQRRAVIDLPEPRVAETLDSFMGFDRGDVIEADVIIYDDQGRRLYHRSLHLEGNVPECYDAKEPRDSLSTHPTGRIIMDVVCRANGPNDVTGNLWARCHLQGTVNFRDPGPPPPPECDIAGPNDPKWEGLGLARTTREELNAAKIIVGDRTGEAPLETLALLAQAINDKGGCARGPWDDEVAIQRADGHVDGWHAVAFGTGGYTGNPGGDSWRYGTDPGGCGPPLPGPLHHAKVKLFQTEPKRTYDSAFLVGPDADYCAAVGYTDGRSMCTVRPDGHPERDACEELAVGTPQWTFDGTGRCFPRPNPYQYRCDDDAEGMLTVCAEKSPGVCATVVVE